MVSFLKRLFGTGKTDKKRKAHLSADELKQWFDLESGKIQSDFRSILESASSQISMQKSEFMNLLLNLETAELRNKDIMPRALQLMEGNRSAYIKKMRDFSDSLMLPDDTSEIAVFLENFDSRLDELNKSTSKAYYVLQEFFANESRKVAMMIKDFEKFVGTIKDGFLVSGLPDIDAARKLVDGYLNSLQRKSDLEKQRRSLQLCVDDAEKRLSELRQSSDSLKKSDGYAEYMRLKMQKDILKGELNQHRKRLSHYFSVIEHALKKYERMTVNEKLVRSYLSDPVCAVMGDSAFEIQSVFEKMKQGILSGAIMLKARKKEKTLSALNELNKEFFDSFVKKERVLLGRLAEAENAARVNEAASSLMGLAEKISLFEKELLEKERELKNVVAGLNGLDITMHESDLQKKLSSMFNCEVEIKQKT